MNTASPPIKGRPLSRRVTFYTSTLLLAFILVISLTGNIYAAVTCDYGKVQSATIPDTVEIECPANAPAGCLPNPNTGIVAPGPLTSCVFAGLDPPIQLRPDAGTGNTFAGAGNGLRGMGISSAPTDTAGNIVATGTVKRTKLNGAVLFSIPSPAEQCASGQLGCTPSTATYPTITSGSSSGATSPTSSTPALFITGTNGTKEIADQSGNPIPGIPAFAGLTASASALLTQMGQLNYALNTKLNANINLGLVKTDSLTGKITLDATGKSIVLPSVTLTASGGIPKLPCGGAIPVLNGPTSMVLNATIQGNIGAAAVQNITAATPNSRDFAQMPHSNIPTATPDMTNGTPSTTSFPAMPFINFPPLPGISYGNIITMGAIQIGPSPAEVGLLHISVPYYNMSTFVANAQRGVSITLNAVATASLTGQVSYSASDFLPGIESALGFPTFLTSLPPLNKPGQPLVNMKRSYFVPPHILSPISPVMKIPSMLLPVANLSLNTDATLTAHLQAAGLLNANADAKAAAAASAAASANGSMNAKLNGSLSGGLNGGTKVNGNVNAGGGVNGGVNGGGGISAGGSTGGNAAANNSISDNPISDMCANGGLTGAAGAKLANMVSGFGGDCDGISSALSGSGTNLNSNGNLTGGLNGNNNGNINSSGSTSLGTTGSTTVNLTNGAGYTFDPANCKFGANANVGGSVGGNGGVNGGINGSVGANGNGGINGNGTGNGGLGGNANGNGGLGAGGSGGLGVGAGIGGLGNGTGNGIDNGLGNGTGNGPGNNSGGFTVHVGESVISSASATGNANFSIINNLQGDVGCPNSVLNVPSNSMQLVVGPVGVSGR